MATFFQKTVLVICMGFVLTACHQGESGDNSSTTSTKAPVMHCASACTPH